MGVYHDANQLSESGYHHADLRGDPDPALGRFGSGSRESVISGRLRGGEKTVGSAASGLSCRSGGCVRGSDDGLYSGDGYLGYDLLLELSDLRYA